MSLAEENELSERELEILRLVATGASNKEIAYRLVISTNTVKVHLRNVFSKIAVSSRTEAAIYAIRIGLVSSNEATINSEANTVPQTNNHQTTPTKTSNDSIYTLRPSGNLNWLQISLVIFLITISLASGYYLLPGLINSETSTPSISSLDSAIRWTKLTSMPTARSGFASVLFDNQIYTIAGESSEGITGVVERYDFQKDEWKPALPKPIAVTDVKAAVIGGKIYLPGGRLADGQTTDKLEIYDPINNTWETGPKLPKAVSAYALTAFEGKLYLFGGWSDNQDMKEVFVYDAQNQKWEVRPGLSSPRSHALAVVASGKIFLLGGVYKNKIFQSIEAYKPDREPVNWDSWTQLSSPPPSVAQFISTTSIADTIFAVVSNNTYPNAISLIYYLPNQNEWKTIDPPPFELNGHSDIVALDTFVILFGGQKANKIRADVIAYEAIFRILLPQTAK